MFCIESNKLATCMSLVKSVLLFTDVVQKCSLVVQNCLFVLLCLNPCVEETDPKEDDVRRVVEELKLFLLKDFCQNISNEEERKKSKDDEVENVSFFSLLTSIRRHQQRATVSNATHRFKF